MIVYMELNLIFTQTDPGVPIVYAGFGSLMLTTCISYLSHSQVKFCLHNEFGLLYFLQNYAVDFC